MNNDKRKETLSPKTDAHLRRFALSLQRITICVEISQACT